MRNSRKKSVISRFLTKAALLSFVLKTTCFSNTPTHAENLCCMNKRIRKGGQWKTFVEGSYCICVTDQKDLFSPQGRSLSAMSAGFSGGSKERSRMSSFRQAVSAFQAKAHQHGGEQHSCETPCSGEKQSTRYGCTHNALNMFELLVCLRITKTSLNKA